MANAASTEHAKIVGHLADAAAVSVGVAAWVEWLPPIAAALSILWLLIQISDYMWKKFHTRKHDRRQGERRQLMYDVKEERRNHERRYADRRK